LGATTIPSFLLDTPFWNDPISSILMTEIDDNFLVSESPILLEGILRSIEGMQYWHLRVIGALVSQDNLAATRLAQFFRKKVNTFHHILQKAKDCLSNNSLVSQTLMKRPDIRALLEPFWRIESHPASLIDLFRHVEPLIRFTGAEGREGGLCHL
jgi:hypothetical protein